ncbi:AAA family ATPase [Methylovulum miyakonense]|uniref:AAA family ATPase n=1 Tax=Methylovulum miyakonense TaxID=645578 RepID=UPI000361BA0F|nr:ATP-binding protein [Methylovulum miyakonense]
MLKKIHVTNYLSCQDTEIEFDQVTVLIGRNGAGKTNILKAIQGCADFAVKSKPFYEYSRDITAINTEFLIDDTTYEYNISGSNYLQHSEEDNDVFDVTELEEKLSFYINVYTWGLIAKRENTKAVLYNVNESIELSIEHKVSTIAATLALLPAERIHPGLKNVYQYLQDIHYYELDNSDLAIVGSPLFESDYRKWLANAERIKSNDLLKLIHLRNQNKQSFSELKSLIGKDGLGLIYDIPILLLNEMYFIHFSVKNGILNGSMVGYNGLSFGTRRILSILLALLYDKSTTLLIEQPEDGIHSGLLKKFLPICFEYAKAYNKQLIIATHSAEVINLVKPQQIRLVRMTEEGTKVSALSDQQLAYVSDYIDNEGTLFEFIDGMDDQ